MRSAPRKQADATAALRQQRRRARLKAEKGRLVQVALSGELAAKLDRLLASGYADDQQAVLLKALDAVDEADES